MPDPAPIALTTFAAVVVAELAVVALVVVVMGV
jgi:hypothetical protein